MTASRSSKVIPACSGFQPVARLHQRFELVEQVTILIADGLDEVRRIASEPPPSTGDAECIGRARRFELRARELGPVEERPAAASRAPARPSGAAGRASSSASCRQSRESRAAGRARMRRSRAATALRAHAIRADRAGRTRDGVETIRNQDPTIREFTPNHAARPPRRCPPTEGGRRYGPPPGERRYTR